ncbi:MAG: hypothetical protein LJU34_03510 [Oscillospiraceae bacterium]|nr:hypothetical protein [Oscillospiraceae bacterium]
MQESMFDEVPEKWDNWVIDPVTKEWLPKPVWEFPPIDYRRVQEHG